MTKQRSLCFIDDDPAELARFKKAMGDAYLIGAGTSLASALDDLEDVQGNKYVDLYVLDMYFPREGTNTAEELSKLGQAWDRFRKAEADLRKVLSRLGQSIEGGLTLANEVKSQGWDTRTPFVFFTRKGNLLDAITAYEHTDALSIIKKPDPRDDFDDSNRSDAYDRAMIEDKDHLIRAFDRAIQRAGFWYRHKGHLEGFIIGFISGIASSMLVWLATKWVG
jgi:hypothetical protein